MLRAAPHEVRVQRLLGVLDLAPADLFALRAGQLTPRLAAKVQSIGRLYIALGATALLAGPAAFSMFFFVAGEWMSLLFLLAVPGGLYGIYLGVQRTRDLSVAVVEGHVTKLYEKPRRVLMVGVDRFPVDNVTLTIAAHDETVDGELLRVYVSQRTRMLLGFEPLS